MKVVLIPGMDGTGILFDPFIRAAPAGIDVVSLPLLQKPNAGYEEQAKSIIDNLGNENFILVAESYSGMVAYNMLKIGCANIRHVVFVASFITCPSKWAFIAKHIPISIIKSSIIPKWLVGKLLFGHYATPYLINLFYKSLRCVEHNVLSHRLAQVAMLKNPIAPITVPCSYIRPLGDNLVSKQSINPFKMLCSRLTVHEVEGTHFVLQTNPEKCWQVIQSAAV